MIGTQLLSSSVKSRSAKQRIASFRKRFGDGHFYLACHAAMPISLTPDLLYSLWANFQRDTHGDTIEIPWIAVPDLMLSSLCEEVGQELYEIEQEVRDELLKQLQQDSRLGLERIRELADFVMAYVEQQLDSPDLDVRDLAQVQHWRALSYKNPSEAVHSIATVLAQLPLSDKSEWIRMDALIGSLAEPLSAYQPLLNYIRAMASLARSNLDAAIAQMSKAVDTNSQVRVEGINLPIPETIRGRLPKPTELDTPSMSSPNKFVLPIAITGGTAISLLILIGIQNGLRSPNGQRTPNIATSVSPSPQITSPTPQETPHSPNTQKSLNTVSSPSPQVILPTSPQVQQSPPTSQKAPITLAQDSKATNEIEQSIFQQINEYRVSKGLPKLDWNSDIAELAKQGSSPSPQVTLPTSPQVQQSPPTSQKAPITLAQDSKATNEIEQSIFQQINEYRVSKGLPKLDWNSDIAELAKQHSEDMANGIAPFGNINFTRRDSNVNKMPEYQSVSQNVAYMTNRANMAPIAVQAWINSEKHRKNIEGKFNLTGIGVSSSETGEVFFTQVFVQK